MDWLLIAVIVWVSVAPPLALLLGRALRLADHRDRGMNRPAVPDFMPDDWTTSTAGRC
jgi:hypothetical protein